ncbi:hypothetical protein ROZALSC1DRAFT_24565 [Rozella allomycis CSF55]|uniref:Uncharacterized protein n=1 Tax=Rozella allomycis (strain CSF55) TaxID=988480 RepID=A0A4P9YFK6_ROZAC|nr:hypothetical protein ROZALSC1DRAFT_24565 [Rozella allomycis CSF55]
MTHLSDYSYIDRGIGILIFFIWAIDHIYTVDGLSSMKLSKIRKKDAKTLCTVLIFTSMLFVMLYDMLSIYIKYSMGMWYDSTMDKCVTMPKARYPDAFLKPLVITDFFFNLAWGTKGSAMFLIQLTWHHVSKTYAGKTDFLSSREIQIFKFVSVISIILYPLLQFVFIPGTVLSTITPQFVSNVQLLAAAILSWYTSKRFTKLKQTLPNNSLIGPRLNHYIQKNRVLGAYLFMEGFFLFLLNLDFITAKYTMHSKFLLDLLTRILNFGSVMVYPTALDLLYPLDVLKGQNTSIEQSKGLPTGMPRKTMDEYGMQLNDSRSIKREIMM